MDEVQSTQDNWWGLFALSLGVFMALLDVTVVNVALPTMAHEFHANFTQLQWVLNAYTITFAVVLLPLSKLGDLYGRRRIFLLSMALFVLSSMVNGLAPYLWLLDVSRAVQAVGGAGMMSLAMALVASNFTGARRGFAIGIMGSVIGLSSALGPLVGGYLVEQYGWPAIFYVNVPVGLLAFWLTQRTIQETPTYGDRGQIDWQGMLLSGVALFSVIYGFIQKETHLHWSWLNPAIMLWLVLGLAAFVAFIWVERHTAAPMLDLRLFASRHFVGATLVAFSLGASIYAVNTYLTGLMQNDMGFSAFGTGLRQLTLSSWALLLGPVTGWLGYRFNKERLVGWCMLLAVAGFTILMVAMGQKLTFSHLVPGMMLIGIANALVNPLLNNATLAPLADADLGMASGLLNVFRQLGVTFGIVMLGLTQSAGYTGALMQAWPRGLPHHLDQTLIEAGAFAGPELVREQGRLLQQTVSQAYQVGMGNVFALAAFLAIGGSLAAFSLMRTKK